MGQGCHCSFVSYPDIFQIEWHSLIPEHSPMSDEKAIFSVFNRHLTLVVIGKLAIKEKIA